MTEERTTEQEVAKTEEKTETVVEKTEQQIPYSRFKEINDAKNALQTQLDEINAKLKKQDEEKLAAEGKKDELITSLTAERDSLKESSDAWEAYQEERRKTLIDKIPEEDRDIYEELSLVKLEKAVDKFSKNVKINVANPGGLGGYKTLAQVAEALRRGDISAEQYKEEKKKFGSR